MEGAFYMKTRTKRIMSVAVVVIIMTGLLTITVSAADVAGAVEGTWNTAKGQIKTIVNNVVFPVIDVILAILLFAKIGTMYLDYKKHGQLDWTAPAILFGCLIFTLTAPLYVWSIVGM